MSQILGHDKECNLGPLMNQEGTAFFPGYQTFPISEEVIFKWQLLRQFSATFTTEVLYLPSHAFVIDHEAGEIIRLVASIRPFVCLCIPAWTKGHSKWLGVQNGCCLDRLRVCGRHPFNSILQLFGQNWAEYSTYDAKNFGIVSNFLQATVQFREFSECSTACWSC